MKSHVGSSSRGKTRAEEEETRGKFQDDAQDEDEQSSQMDMIKIYLVKIISVTQRHVL